MATASSGIRDRRRQETRAEILSAAWRLADRDGIAGLSLRDLAAEVGMQAPSLYTYFGSKAAIYDDMFVAGYRQLDSAWAALTVETDDPVATLVRHIEVFIDFCRASVARYQLMFTRAIPDWEPTPEAYGVSVASYGEMAARLAELGVDDAADLDLLTALTSGLAAQQLANEPDGHRWRDLSRAAAEMFLTHVRRP